MVVRLFIDDVRIPIECVPYMKKRIGSDVDEYKKDWVIVRNYEDFVDYIKENGLPDIISFDDLTHTRLTTSDVWEKRYDTLHDGEETGADCAKFLYSFCRKHETELPIYYIHTMNIVEVDNILNALKQ